MKQKPVKKPAGSRNILWTPQRIEQATRSAARGRLRLLSDYALEQNNDDRVGACMEVRVGTVAGLSLTFEHENPDVVAAISEDWWTMFPETTLQTLIFWGDMVGAGPGVQDWRFHEGRGRWVPTVEAWTPRDLRQDRKTEQWYAETASGEKPIDLGTGEWVLYTPYGKSEPWEWALTQALIEPWLAKQYTNQDWTGYDQRHGMPITHGTAPQGAQDKDVDAFTDDVEATAKTGCIVTREGYKIELKEATALSWRSFEAREARADEKIAVRTLGQNLTTVVKGGSLAAADIHDQIRISVLKGMVEKVSTQLRAQVVVPWYAYNFGGSPDKAPWPRWNTARPVSAKDQAASDESVFKAVAAAKAVQAPIDENQYYRERGIVLKETP